MDVCPVLRFTPDDQALVSFWVPGLAKTQGSKHSFINPRTGKVVMKEQIKGLPAWRSDTKVFALKEMHGQVMMVDCPVFVHLYFVLKRPVALKAHHPTPPAIKQRGDVDKLTRAIYDACTGIIYGDDAQVTEQFGTKRVAEYGEQPGCWISAGPVGNM